MFPARKAQASQPPTSGSASFRVLLGFLLISAFGLAAAPSQQPTNASPEAALPVLTNVQQVLALGPYNARELHQPARLRGVVVLFSATAILLHDGTACILIYTTNSPASMRLGSVVQADGITESGLQAPMLINSGVQVLGDAPLPAPERLPIARMLAGEGCWQYVQIEGVVRDMNRDALNLALSIASENRLFTATIGRFDRIRPQGLPFDWLEARVLLEGICWTDVNDRNQAVSFHLVLADTNHIRFLSPGRTNLFALPSLSPTQAHLLRQPSDTRIKVSGIVLALVGSERLFLQTSFGSIRARLDPLISRGGPRTEVVPRPPPPQLSPGDKVDLLGAPAESPFAPFLVDGECTLVGPAPAPAPAPVNASGLLTGRHDASLVRLRARLLNQQSRTSDSGLATIESLVLESGDTVFEAAWQSETTNRLPAFPVNARLQLDGICEMQPGPTNLPQTFRIILRGPGDVLYLGQAPLWTHSGAARALQLTGILLCAGGLWIWLLRRKIHERTAALASANQNLRREAGEREKAQSDLARALAAERELGELKSRFVSMVSHEFRTPLGITMSAVELLRHYLDRLPRQKLQELLNDIHSSTLRMSALMEQVLLLGRVEAGKIGFKSAPVDLGSLAAKLIEEASIATSHKCPVHFLAHNDLSGAHGDEGLLRHIFSNLLSNAVKYSPPGMDVSFEARREGNDMTFLVQDHGIGIPSADQPRLFEPFHRASNAAEIPGTGLGLLIVKRCVQLHQGSISFTSAVGTGTTFTIHLPLFPTTRADRGCVEDQPQHPPPAAHP